jgi:hypothetical protein
MNKSRILRAIEVLSEITPAQSHYNAWFRNAAPIGVEGAKPTCGTIGLDPQAQHQVVYFVKRGFEDTLEIKGPFYGKLQGESACAEYGVPVSPQHIIELLQKILAGEEIEELADEEIADEE